MEFTFRDDDEAVRTEESLTVALDETDNLHEQGDSQNTDHEGMRDNVGDAMVHEHIPLFEFSPEDLAAISDFVDDETAALQPSKQIRDPSSHRIKADITWDPNRARNRRKGELIYLRNLAVELETQLCSLKAMRSKKIKSTASFSAPRRQLGSAPATLGIVERVWRDIGHRQRDERAKSERENISLKLLLERHLKNAQHLGSFLARITSRKDMSDVASPNRQPPRMIFVSRGCHTDADIFADLATGIQTSYAEIDAVFDANGLSRMESSYFDAQTHYDHKCNMRLEVFANHVLPFDLHSTGAAAWHHLSSAKERLPHRTYHYELPRKNVDATGSTITENFHLTLYSKSTSATFRVHQIFQRFTEASRVVVVWRAYIETVEFAETPVPPGLCFLKKGYMILKKPSNENVANCTLLQPCYVITPVYDTNGKMPQDSLRGELTKFILQAIGTNVRATNELLETTLLAQSRQLQAT